MIKILELLGCPLENDLKHYEGMQESLDYLKAMTSGRDYKNQIEKKFSKTSDLMRNLLTSML